MSGRALRLGTRRSRLATSQSQLVADAITAATGRAVDLVEVTTEGDVNRQSLSQIGGTGVFVSALRDALLSGDVDIAVHSLKDLPTTPEPGLALAAVPVREDPRDVLVARDGLTLGELPEGAVIGTGSPRRTAQLRALGLGVDVVDIRGNVDTRLGLVTSGTLDAVVLARAGLLRLGLAELATEVLDPLQMLPAPGQGALAVECRAGDEDTLAVCRVLDDETTRACVVAERALLAALEAGCTAPLGALADVGEGDAGPELFLRAVVASLEGVDLRRSTTGPVSKAADLGRGLASTLLADGAAELMAPEPRPPRDGVTAPPRPRQNPFDNTIQNDAPEATRTGGRPATVESET
jgi:hydroxymethylbilane synthase